MAGPGDVRRPRIAERGESRAEMRGCGAGAGVDRHHVASRAPGAARGEWAAVASPRIGARHKITEDGMPSREFLWYTLQNRSA